MQSSVSLSEPPAGMCCSLVQREPELVGDEGWVDGVAGVEVGGDELAGDEGCPDGTGLMDEDEPEGASEGMGVVGVDEPGFDREAPPPLGTGWTVVSPPWLLAGTLTVTGFWEMPPSTKPCTGGGPLG